jgi:hypothetical protein
MPFLSENKTKGKKDTVEDSLRKIKFHDTGTIHRKKKREEVRR